MSLSRRSSLGSTQSELNRDLKLRVFTCLNKLSDRDTHAGAAVELESIARNLSHDSFSPFIASVAGTDTSDKSPVRKQCVKILGFLSETHGDELSPFLTKMISAVVRRLRDSDSAVRLACIDAVAVMSSQITKPPFSLFVKHFSEALLVELDHSSQIGSALCLASAIDASPDPEPAQLRLLLPRLVKLLKNESFKAKPALLTLIGSVAAAGGASCSSALRNLIPAMGEFLSGEDWAARKAASEAFLKLVVVDKGLLLEFKASCLKVFETRRFDKVKAVRESMNQMIEAWRQIPDVSGDVSPPPVSLSTSRENGSDGRYPPGSKGSITLRSETPQTKRHHISANRSPPPDNSPATTSRKKSPLKTSDKKMSSAMFRKLDRKKPSKWKVEITVPQASSAKEVHEDDGRVLEGEIEDDRFSEQEASRGLCDNKSCDEKTRRSGGLRSVSRVVPCEEEVSESTVVVSNATEEVYRNQKECEDLSLIRKQLVQIENQQSSLLDLLQKFMGSSQNGLHSLESRVHGLELALDEISFDLAVTTGRMPNPESTGTSCCILPGADFLSSKFRRRNEGQGQGRFSTSRFSSSSATPFLTAMRSEADKNSNFETFKQEIRMSRLHRGGGSGGGFVVNPLAEIHSGSRGISEVSAN